jgi:hypothetical protein
MLIIWRFTNVVTLLSPPRSLVPRLGLGNLWVRQLKSGSCLHPPTLATKCNVFKAHKPYRWKASSPSRVVYALIYWILSFMWIHHLLFSHIVMLIIIWRSTNVVTRVFSNSFSIQFRVTRYLSIIFLFQLFPFVPAM